jgi:hypothetical protein
MTSTSLSYPLLLLSWIPMIPLLVMAIRRGEKVRGLGIALGLNVLFMLYEAYMSFVWSTTVIAPIRVDVFLVIVILVAVNLLTGFSRVFSKSRSLERAAGLALVLISLNAASGIVRIFAEGHAVSRQIDLQKKLQFEAMFRDQSSVKHFFGDINGGGNTWAGHYVADRINGGFLTRLVINTDGKVWVFFTCSEGAECVYIEGEDEALKGSGPAVNAGGLKAPVGTGTMHLELKRESADRLSATLAMEAADSGTANRLASTTANVMFARTPPPAFAGAANPARAPDQVKFLGVFSNGYLDSDALFVVQLWIWQKDGAAFGRYVRRGWKLGTVASFVSTQPFSGTLDDGSHAIDFAVSKQEGFRGTFNGSDILDGEVLWFGRPLHAITLKKKELLPGFSYEYAPLTSEKETRAWLETMSVGKMVEWQLPAAFDPASW